MYCKQFLNIERNRKSLYSRSNHKLINKKNLKCYKVIKKGTLSLNVDQNLRIKQIIKMFDIIKLDSLKIIKVIVSLK